MKNARGTGKLFAFAASFALAACAGMGANQVARNFDLGIEAPQARLPAVRLVAVRASAPFDSLDMYYRLAWRNPGELASFANSRWAALPADLLRKQLLRASPESAAAPCALELELQEFTQVFASPQISEARLEWRAVLANGTARIAARSMTVVEPGAGTDAASGAAAFARAADRALGDLAGWISAQRSCQAKPAS